MQSRHPVHISVRNCSRCFSARSADRLWSLDGSSLRDARFIRECYIRLFGESQMRRAMRDATRDVKLFMIISDSRQQI